MTDRYILVDGKPEPADDLIGWARWFEKADRVVKKDTFGEVMVSTVFLGLNHNFDVTGPPLLWETMIFGGAHDQFCARYASVEAAKAGHESACRMVRP